MRSSRLLIAVLLLLPCLDASAQTVRLATWNLESLGTPGGSQWTAALDVLGRVGADIVAVQEVDISENASFVTFRNLAGYAHGATSGLSGTLSGGLQLAVLSQHPIVSMTTHTSVSLSGDSGANDLTRPIYEVQIQLPGLSDPLGLFIVHLKAGTGGTNDFRRAVEIVRCQQVINGFLVANPQAPWAILGDFNEDTGDGPFGNSFNSLPSSLPGSYQLGSDIQLPLIYQPFQTFTGLGGSVLDATQEDTTGDFTTRPASGRRLDYLVLAGSYTLSGDEVYNSSRDNGIDDLPLGNWLPKFGPALSSATSLAAADHLPVFCDVTYSGAPPPAAIDYLPGDVIVSEYLADPSVVSDGNGEWIELRNTTATAIDLAGFQIRDQGNDSFTLPSLNLPARGYALLAANGTFAQNGGTFPDFVWPQGSFFLSNGSDEIEVVSPQGVLLDAIAYDNGATWPDPSGASVERRDPTALSFPANFGVALTQFGGGDLGTPGVTNSLDTNPAFTTLSLVGVPLTGSLFFIGIDATPALAGRTYILAASGCPSPGIPLVVTGRVIDLCLDPLLTLSVTPGNGVFSNFIGNLNAFGLGTGFVTLPAIPQLAGTELFFSGVVLEAGVTEGIVSVMDNLTVTLQ